MIRASIQAFMLLAIFTGLALALSSVLAPLYFPLIILHYYPETNLAWAIGLPIGCLFLLFVQILCGRES